MVDDEAPITGHTTAIRRVKYVSSHEVHEGELAEREIQPYQPPPEDVYLPNSAMEDLRDPDSAPAMDPTEMVPHRPRRHRIRYRLAQLATTAALAASAAAVIAVALADHNFAN